MRRILFVLVLVLGSGCGDPRPTVADLDAAKRLVEQYDAEAFQLAKEYMAAKNDPSVKPEDLETVTSRLQEANRKSESMRQKMKKIEGDLVN